MTKKGDPNPVVMLNSFQHLVKIFSGFGRHTFHPRPQYGVSRCDLNKAGKVVGIHLRPHDLRRHAATYASRSGVPIEIVSKVILRHANLSTTQRYLGTVSDVEAMRWIDNLYG